MRIDRTAPYITDLVIFSIFDNVDGLYKVDVSGIVRDALGLKDVNVYIRDGNPDWGFNLDCNNTVEQTMNGSVTLGNNNANPGEIMYIVIEATDMAGNTTNCERPFVLEDQEQLSDWNYQKDIVISIPGNLQITGELTDFPVIVKLDNSNFNFSEAIINGQDIRFAKNGIIIPNEIESWDSETGKAFIWVKIPKIISGLQNQIVTMYWGNAAATISSRSPLVWDKNFKAVYHMNTFDAEGEQPLSPYVIYTKEKTDIRDWVQITGQKIGSANYVEIGADAKVSGDIMCSGGAFFRDRASITGNVVLGRTLAVQPDVAISGDLLQNQDVQPEDIPERLLQYIVESRVVEPGMALDLPAGDYGDIIVRGGGTLRLHNGTYQFNNLQFNADALFEIDPLQGEIVSINTQSSLEFGDRVKCHFTGDYLNTNVFFYSNQDEELVFGVSSQICGTVVAPNASVTINSNANFTGSITAKSVTIEPYAIIKGFSATQTAPAIVEFVRDATLHELHAEDFGVTEIPGIIGIAQNFNGTSSHIRCPNLLRSPTNQQMTISGWIQRTRTGLVENVVGIDGESQITRFIVGENDNFILQTQAELLQKSATATDAKEWMYFSGSYDNSKLRLHINGELAEEKVTESPIPAVEVPVFIGTWIDTDFFGGKIDEIRVSDIARSNDWERLSYENQKENSRIVIVPPVAPRGVQTTLINPNSVRISWEYSSSVDLIRIERTEINNGTWLTIANIPVSDKEYLDENLECGKSIIYRFSYSTSGITSDYSEDDTVHMFICPEEQPSELIAEALNDNSIRLWWADNANDENSFEIQKKLFSEEEFINAGNAPPDATSSIIGDLSCLTEYDFRLRVVKDSNVSDWIYSNRISTENCNGVPAAPDNLIIVSNSGKYALSWRDNSDNEEFFALYRAATATGTVNSGDFKLIDILPNRITQYEDNSYPCGKYLTYKVAAFNTASGGGLSDPSNTVQVQSAFCVEGRGKNLISLSCMLTGNNGQPIFDQNAQIIVNLYDDPVTISSLYSETFALAIKNGYLHINLGTYQDITAIIKDKSKLYYEITYNNNKIPVRYPLTSSLNSINNTMILKGSGSPSSIVDAVPGSLYLNTVTRTLYFKFGVSINDWKRIE